MPLPKPKKGEERNEFITRCVTQQEITTEFDTQSQRVAVCHSLWEGKEEKAQNLFNLKYITEYDNQRRIAESRNINSLKNFYFNEYNKGINIVLNGGDVNPNQIFQEATFMMMLIEMYKDIGLHFAKWYVRYFEKNIKKQTDLQFWSEKWIEDFQRYGYQYAARNIKLIQGTALFTFKKIVRQLFSDPEFAQIGTGEMGRVLRNKFKQISKYQAERIVRTETTTVSNYATYKSALTMYDEKEMDKRWITSLDGRERAWHREANNQQVDAMAKFNVGGELIDRAGLGNAKNRINCRCAVVYVPKQNLLD